MELYFSLKHKVSKEENLTAFIAGQQCEKYIHAASFRQQVHLNNRTDQV